MMRKALLIVAVLLAVLVCAVLVIPFLVDVDQFRPQIEAKLGSMLGRQVKIGHLELSIIRGELKASEISISEDPRFGTTPFVRAKLFEAGVELKPLILSRALQIRSLAFTEPDVILLRNAAGKWNFSSLGGAQQAPSGVPSAQGTNTAVAVQRLKILKGKLSIGSPGKKPQMYQDVNLSAENIAVGSSIPATLQARTASGGTLDVQGKVGPLNSQDVAQTPFEVKVVLKRLDLGGVLDPASGIAGVMDYDGTVRSDGRAVRSQATAAFDKLRVVKTGTPATQRVSLVYASDYNMERQSGQLTRGEVKTGKGNVSVTGNYESRADTVVHLKLDAPSIPVEDIQALLPAVGVTLPSGSSLHGGAAAAHLAIEGPVNELTTSGDVNLSNTRLTGFALASKLAVLSAFTGIKASPDTLIQTMSSAVHISSNGIRSDDLKLVVSSLGELSGSGTIGANGALNFKLLAKVAQTGLGGILSNLAQRAGVGGAVANGIPFIVQGTTSAPVFLPDTAAIAKQGLATPAQPNTPGAAASSNRWGDVVGGILGRKKSQ